MIKFGNVEHADVVLWSGAEFPVLELKIPVRETADGTIEQLELKLPCWDTDPEEGVNMPSPDVGISGIAWVDELFELITPLKPGDTLFSRKAEKDGSSSWSMFETGDGKVKTTVPMSCARYVVCNVTDLWADAVHHGVRRAPYTDKNGVTRVSYVLAYTAKTPFVVQLDCGHATPDSWGKRPKKA